MRLKGVFLLSQLLMTALLSTNVYADTQPPAYYGDNRLPPPPPPPASQTMERDSQGMMPYSPQNQQLQRDIDPGINDNIAPPHPEQDRGMETQGIDRSMPPPPPNNEAGNIQAPARMQRPHKPGRAPRGAMPGSTPSTSGPSAAPMTAPSGSGPAGPGPAGPKPAGSGPAAPGPSGTSPSDASPPGGM